MDKKTHNLHALNRREDTGTSKVRERDFTLRGLVAEFAEGGLKVHYRLVWHFVHAEKLSFKKRRRQRARSSRHRPQVGDVSESRVAPEWLVFSTRPRPRPRQHGVIGRWAM